MWSPGRRRRSLTPSVRPSAGIVWYRWRGWDYSLKRSVMMIRPNRRAKEADTEADAD